MKMEATATRRSGAERRELGSSLLCRIPVQNRAGEEAGGTSALGMLLFEPGPGNRSWGSWGHGGLAASRMGATVAGSLLWIMAAASSAPCCGDPGGNSCSRE